MEDLFIDTSYLIALVNTRDVFHPQAKEWAERLIRYQITCHISVPILFEIADGFSRLLRREIGIEFIENILAAQNYVVHGFEDEIYLRALKLYSSRKDKEWGLTDCYSFELMKKLDLTTVLTADKHFKQYGYSILLK